jgi:hypothetical protein
MKRGRELREEEGEEGSSKGIKRIALENENPFVIDDVYYSAYDKCDFVSAIMLGSTCSGARFAWKSYHVQRWSSPEGPPVYEDASQFDYARLWALENFNFAQMTPSKYLKHVRSRVLLRCGIEGVGYCGTESIWKYDDEDSLVIAFGGYETSWPTGAADAYLGRLNNVKYALDFAESTFSSLAASIYNDLRESYERHGPESMKTTQNEITKYDERTRSLANTCMEEIVCTMNSAIEGKRNDVVSEIYERYGRASLDFQDPSMVKSIAEGGYYESLIKDVASKGGLNVTSTCTHRFGTCDYHSEIYRGRLVKSKTCMTKKELDFEYTDSESKRESRTRPAVLGDPNDPCVRIMVGTSIRAMTMTFLTCLSTEMLKDLAPHLKEALISGRTVLEGESCEGHVGYQPCDISVKRLLKHAWIGALRSDGGFETQKEKFEWALKSFFIKEETGRALSKHPCTHKYRTQRDDVGGWLDNLIDYNPSFRAMQISKFLPFRTSDYRKAIDGFIVGSSENDARESFRCAEEDAKGGKMYCAEKMIKLYCKIRGSLRRKVKGCDDAAWIDWIKKRSGLAENLEAHDDAFAFAFAFGEKTTISTLRVALCRCEETLQAALETRVGNLVRVDGSLGGRCARYFGSLNLSKCTASERFFATTWHEWKNAHTKAGVFDIGSADSSGSYDYFLKLARKGKIKELDAYHETIKGAVFTSSFAKIVLESSPISVLEWLWEKGYGAEIERAVREEPCEETDVYARNECGKRRNGVCQGIIRAIRGKATAEKNLAIAVFFHEKKGKGDRCASLLEIACRNMHGDRNNKKRRKRTDSVVIRNGRPCKVSKKESDVYEDLGEKSDPFYREISLMTVFHERAYALSDPKTLAYVTTQLKLPFCYPNASKYVRSNAIRLTQMPGTEHWKAFRSLELEGMRSGIDWQSVIGCSIDNYRRDVLKWAVEAGLTDKKKLLEMIKTCSACPGALEKDCFGLCDDMLAYLNEEDPVIAQ